MRNVRVSWCCDQLFINCCEIAFAMQVDKDQYEKVLKYIDIGKREGATLVAGGKPCGDKGYYIEPTIFTDVKVKCFTEKLILFSVAMEAKMNTN